MMAYLYYTLIGIGLYFISDWLLDRIENAYGRRFQYRGLVFFIIIMVLALITSQTVNLFSSILG
ncbi:MAG: hypothetical protein PHT15_04240 [Gallionellaceae bacterium]|nr:hypothetical protein [Gallionellaceae bacterium]